VLASTTFICCLTSQFFPSYCKLGGMSWCRALLDKSMRSEYIIGVMLSVVIYS